MPIDSGMVARTARKALEKAQERHEEWSGWWWAPPEYVATVEVAGAVRRCAGVAWVTPEHGTLHTLNDPAGGIEPSKLLPQGRFDIVVWTNKRPRGVIEVKTRGYSKILADVERICDAIRDSRRIEGSRPIDWGLAAFICARVNGKVKSGRDRVRDAATSVAGKAARAVREHGLTLVRHDGTVRPEEDRAWVAEVLEIRG